MSGESFDAVVIGSGLGGLTAAALLAKAGRKVCVIERNHSVGGAASAFKKGALTIEPSLHQTADPRDPREPKHEILEELGLLDEIEWVPVSPFFSVRGGPVGETFDLPVGFDAAREAMARRFPKSRPGIDRLFALMETFAGWRRRLEPGARRALGRQVAARRSGIALAGRRLARFARRRVGAHARRRRGGEVRDRRQSRLLRRRSAPHVVAVLRAGAGRISKCRRRLHQGRFAHAQHEARQGRDEGGRQRSLGTRGGRRRHRRERAARLSCATSIRRRAKRSSASPRKSCSPIARRMSWRACSASRCAGPSSAPTARARSRRRCSRRISASTRRRQSSVSIATERWCCPEWTTSLRDTAESARLLAADPGGRLPIYGIANYGAIDSGLADGGPTLVSVVGLDRLSNWAGLTPQQEKDRRERWLDAFHAALERDYPGFGGAVTERMFLNARSMHNFLNTPDGAVYGFAPMPPQRGIWAGVPRSPRTPIPGLYLASSFAGSGGFTGAMMSGADAARMAIGEWTS